MKTVLRYLVVCIIAVFSSCQEEENVVIQDTSNNLTKVSPATRLLSRVVQNSTSTDNVLDGTSVFRVKLPVAITLNATSLTVASISDYAVVQALKDASNLDDDIVNYSFPIVVSLRNFQEIAVSNQSQLNAIISLNEDLSDISCVSLVYPVSISVYDSSNQIANVVTFTSNSMAINYLNGLQSNVFYSINYPISVVNSSSQTVVVNSNSQLLSIIETGLSVCGLNFGNIDDFVTVITSGTWRVSYYFDDDEDETNNFFGYVFTFNTNNTITVVKNGDTYPGIWSFYEDDGVYKIDLEFSDSVLSDLNDDWDLLEFSNNLIQLKEDGDDEFLSFSKN